MYSTNTDIGLAFTLCSQDQACFPVCCMQHLDKVIFTYKEWRVRGTSWQLKCEEFFSHKENIFFIRKH